MDGEAVAGKLSDTCEAEQKGQREALERSLAKDEERIDVLERWFCGCMRIWLPDVSAKQTSIC